MKSFIFGLAILVAFALEVQHVNGAIVTADVAVHSSEGLYTLLLPGVQNSDWYQYVWGDVPEFFIQHNALFWQYKHTAYPTWEDGVVEFEVLNTGPVLMACTTRWGGGGNSDGDWEDELTIREELEQQGWTEYATGLTLRHFGYPSEPAIDYVIFSRDCVAGETFSYRTEKYEPPTIIRSMSTIPEPSTGTYLYDAGLNTLPEDQGWSNYSVGSNPSPTVSDGILYQNAITTDSVQNWFVQVDPFDFDSNEYCILEAELKVTSSGYNRGENRWRAGYGLAIKDIDKQAIILGISSTGVQMTNDSYDWQDANSSSFYSFDTTSGFHVYRLTVSQGMAELEIDDVPVLS